MGLLDLDDLIAGKKSKPDKDKRRSFTKTQQNEILHQQNNKCARCKNRIDPRDKHFHHAKAWADGGRTLVKNGRAVCGSCHNILTHKDRLKKVDKSKKNKKPASLIGDLPDPFGSIIKRRKKKINIWDF